MKPRKGLVICNRRKLVSPIKNPLTLSITHQPPFINCKIYVRFVYILFHTIFWQLFKATCLSYVLVTLQVLNIYLFPKGISSHYNWQRRIKVKKNQKNSAGFNYLPWGSDSFPSLASFKSGFKCIWLAPAVGLRRDATFDFSTFVVKETLQLWLLNWTFSNSVNKIEHISTPC